MTTSTLPGIAVFTGSDSVRLEQEKADLFKRIRHVHGDTVSWEIFDETREDFSAFTARMVTGSLFSSFRVFIIRHSMVFFTQHVQTLHWLLDTSMSDSCVLLEIGSDDVKNQRKRKNKTELEEWWTRLRRMQNSDAQRYRVYSYEKPREYQLPEWITTIASQIYGRKIAPADAALLVDLVGTELGTLNSELEKIDIALPHGEEITTEAIRKAVDASRSASGYELAHALGTRDAPRTFKIIDSLFHHTFYGPMIVSALYRHFWQLFRIRLFGRSHKEDIRALTRKSSYAKQNEAGLRVGIAAGILTKAQKKRVYPAVIKSGIVSQAFSYSMEEYEKIFTCLCSWDVAVKTGASRAAKEELQLLCYSILHVSNVNEAAQDKGILSARV